MLVKKILLAAGDRHGLLKVLPVYKALSEHDRYDAVLAAGSPLPKGERSGEDLPDLFGMHGDIVPIGGEGISPVGRTASAMQEFEELLLAEQPDFLLVGGYDDIALSAALAASKLGFAVAPFGAGMRDYNRNSQAEINRKIIDTVADILFVSEHSGEYNLISEGFDEARIFFVGELAIDSLAAVIEKVNSSTVTGDFGIEEKKYVLFLLDNPAAFDSDTALKRVLRVVTSVARDHQVLVLLGPDEGTIMQKHEMGEDFTTVPGVQVLPFPGYVELLRLVKDALFVLTDSTLAQAESTVMKVPCLTMLDDTASPATIEIGTNILVGDREEDILQAISEADLGEIGKKSKIPEKWDGDVTRRVIDVLDKVLE